MRNGKARNVGRVARSAVLTAIVMAVLLTAGVSAGQDAFVASKNAEPPVKEYEYSYLHGRWQMWMKNYFVYDSRGSMLVKITVNDQERCTAVVYRNTYKDGRLCKYRADRDTNWLDADYHIIKKRVGPVDGGCVTTNTYTYQNGMLAAFQAADTDGGGGEPKVHASNTYKNAMYPDGTLKKRLEYRNGNLISMRVYNRKGFRTACYYYDSQGRIYDRFITIYTYDRKGRVIQQTEYYNGKPNFRYRYFYGKHTRKIAQNLFLNYFIHLG